MVIVFFSLKVGFGAVPSFRPPKQSYDYDYYANSSYPGKPTGAYATQYQGRNLGVQSMPRGYVGTEQDAASKPVSASMGGPMNFPANNGHDSDLDTH